MIGSWLSLPSISSDLIQSSFLVSDLLENIFFLANKMEIRGAWLDERLVQDNPATWDNTGIKIMAKIWGYLPHVRHCNSSLYNSCHSHHNTMKSVL